MSRMKSITTKENDMTSPKWLMKAQMSHDTPTIYFTIVDKHHLDQVYGSWQANTLDELNYHVNGITEMIDRGTYHKSAYFYNDAPVASWNEMIAMMERHIVNYEEKKVA